MKGYVSINPETSVIERIKAAVQTVDDFIEMMETTPVGHISTEKAWFGLTTREVWVVGTPDTIPYGAYVHRGYYKLVKGKRTLKTKYIYSLPDHVDFKETRYYNNSAETTDNYNHMKDILALYKANPDMIQLGEKLVRVYNKFSGEYNEK